MKPSEKYALILADVLETATAPERRVAMLRGANQVVEEVVLGVAAEVEMSPFDLLALRAQLTTLAEHAEVERRAKLIEALQSRGDGLIERQRAWRHERGGNLVVSFTGGTGLGKSSSMLGVMERHAGLTAENVARRVFIDPRRMIAALPGLEPGSAVALDEQSELYGEGADTVAALMANVEEQIRQARIDLLHASPTPRENAVVQGRLHALGMDRNGKRSCFLLYVGEEPVCRMWLPWCSSATWAAYQSVKVENVRRATLGQFHDSEFVTRAALAMFESRSLLALARLRPVKAQDFKRTARRELQGMSTAEREAVVHEAELMLSLASEDDGEAFNAVFGVAMPAALRAFVLATR